MAVSNSKAISFLPWGDLADVRHPHGIFSGSLSSTGDASGGNHTVTLTLPDAHGADRILLIRYIAVRGPATAVALQVSAGPNLFLQGSSTIVSSVVPDNGINRSGAGLASRLPMLWRRVRTEVGLGFLEVVAANVDNEIIDIHAQGEYWEEDLLRSAGVSPLVSW